MGFIGNVEKKIESAVSAAFARAFRGDVQPVEITARLLRELDSEAQLLSRDKRLVPNDFLVGLSVQDYARLFPYSRTLNDEIVAELRGSTRSSGRTSSTGRSRSTTRSARTFRPDGSS